MLPCWAKPCQAKLCRSTLDWAMPCHAMPDKAILHYTGLCSALPSPAVARPVGSGTTRHSRVVSHGGHAWAAPMWEGTQGKPQGNGSCSGWPLLAPISKRQLVGWVLAVTAWAGRSEVVWTQPPHVRGKEEGHGVGDTRRDHRAQPWHQVNKPWDKAQCRASPS